MDYTVLTNLKVTGKLEAENIEFGLTESDYKVTSDDAPTMGESYSQADVQKLATLANEIKADLNRLVKMLATGSNT